MSAYLGILLLLTGCTMFRSAVTGALGAARTVAYELPAGSLEVPTAPRLSPVEEASTGGFASKAAADVVRSWAERDLPDWQEEGKVAAPRVLLAKLATGKDVDTVNDYLRAAVPWAKIGSTWGLRPNGDYDFSLPPLTAILYLFGDRGHAQRGGVGRPLLRSDVQSHLVNVLLDQHGPGFQTTVPGSLGLVTETENHILMIEGSRYLKNQWLRLNGDTDPRYDNRRNGLEEKLTAFIREIDAAGPYEFNSTPYFGYTAMALLTLEAFAGDPVASAARSLLDRMNYEFALGSSGLRRYAPYRRQPRRAGMTDLTNHPHTAMMRVWLGDEAAAAVTDNQHHAVYAALMPYRLPSAVAEAARAGGEREYFVRIGRGPGASPELYSSGPGFLLSAGGTGREPRSLIVARPTVLFLNDGAVDLSETFHIGGAGDYHEWNNTGVLHRFAVARAPLHVPQGIEPAVSGKPWSVYIVDGTADERQLLVAAADTGTVAALYLPEKTSSEAKQLAEQLNRNSPSSLLEAGQAVLPDGRSVEFDLSVSSDLWVISTPKEAGRRVTEWPRLSGWIGSRDHRSTR